VTRPEELAEIERFIALRGVTRCPSAFAVPTDLSRTEEARRLSFLQLKTPTKEELKRAFWWGRSRPS
jgi:hypothetical protein